MALKSNWNTGDSFSASAQNDVATAVNAMSPPQFGTYAARPAAGDAGLMYYCTDCDSVYYDNGSTWTRVSIGGTVGPFGDVPTTGWSAVNAGSSTFAADKDSMLLTRPTSAATDYNLYVRTLSPTSNYTATFYLDITATPLTGGVWLAGIILRNSSSGYFITFEALMAPASYYGLTMRSSKYTSASTFSAYNQDAVYAVGGIPNWWRFRDNNTNRYLEYSYNGIDWTTFFSVGRTDFMTPDQIGVGAYNQSTGKDVVVRIRSLNGVA